MNRRKARENAFIAFFELSFSEAATPVEARLPTEEEDSDYAMDEFGHKLLELYGLYAEAVNTTIETRLKGWKVLRLPRVSLAILRMSVTEMLFGAPGMDSVVINEAVELSKKFGDEGDYQFINGVLGSVARDEDIARHKEAEQPLSQQNDDEAPCSAPPAPGV